MNLHSLVLVRAHEKALSKGHLHKPLGLLNKEPKLMKDPIGTKKFKIYYSPHSSSKEMNREAPKAIATMGEENMGDDQPDLHH